MRIILVSHGRLALGMQDTVKFIMGGGGNSQSISLCGLR